MSSLEDDQAALELLRTAAAVPFTVIAHEVIPGSIVDALDDNCDRFCLDGTIPAKNLFFASWNLRPAYHS
jgi:hypothetical protein